MKIKLEYRFRFFEYRYQFQKRLCKIIIVSTLLFLAREYLVYASQPLMLENPALTTTVAIAASSEDTAFSPVRSDPNDPAVVEGEIEKKIRAVFGEDEYPIARAVAYCESRLDPNRIGDTNMREYSYGIFQINRTWHKYPVETLLDADENIRIAKEIRDKGGWKRWSCFSQGFYTQYL